jgi:hypothetical protein
MEDASVDTVEICGVLPDEVVIKEHPVFNAPCVVPYRARKGHAGP